MNRYLELFTLIITVLQSSIISPCSIFKFIDDDGTVYFCGNEDWSAKDPAILTLKQDDNNFGVVIFGWQSYLPEYPQAGINSEGLCFDWATVPTQRYVYQKGKENLNINSLIDILKKCKTIDDAITYINKYNFTHLAEEHLMLADKNGNSCVIEFTKGTLKIIKGKDNVQFITNFNLTDKENGWYPCERYSKIENYFNNKAVNFNAVSILDEVHQEGSYPTIYSYIFNLQSMIINVYYNHNYNKSTVYKVSDLITDNKLYKIK